MNSRAKHEMFAKRRLAARRAVAVARKIVGYGAALVFVLSVLAALIVPVTAHAMLQSQLTAPASQSDTNIASMPCHQKAESALPYAVDSRKSGHDHKSDSPDDDGTAKSCCDLACHTATIVDSDLRWPPHVSEVGRLALVVRLTTTETTKYKRPPRSSLPHAEG